MTTLHVLSTESFSPAWLDEVASLSPRVRVEQHSAARLADLPRASLQRAEVLYTSRCFPSPHQAPRLRWIQLDTSGADHVDPAWRPDVAVTSISGVSDRPLAEYVVLMVLAFAHRLPAILANQAERGWPPDMEARWAHYRPAQLAGATLSVVGYGRLGRSIGRLARAFDLEVIGVRRGGGSAEGERAGGDGEEAGGAGVEVVTADRLHDALARADYVTVVVPRTPQTLGLLDEAAFRALKPGAVLVNASRGGVVDEAAMLAALDDGRLQGVAADVFAQEPLPGYSPLWTHPRVLASPHVAGLAPDYAERVGRLFKANLIRYLDGAPLENRIDRDLGY